MDKATQRNPEQTRSIILDAAFKEVYENGFQAASLDRILANTQLTKGALYHHFPNKQAMGLALVDELIGPVINQQMIEPLEKTDDPIALLTEMIDLRIDCQPDNSMRCGCPLNNLSQEMSANDPEFREHVKAVFDRWRDALAGALRRGQDRGNVRGDLACNQAALFIIAVHEGCIGMGKTYQSANLFRDLATQMKLFLQTLRP